MKKPAIRYAIDVPIAEVHKIRILLLLISDGKLLCGESSLSYLCEDYFKMVKNCVVVDTR